MNESGCCPQCLAELPDHWLSDFWRYCPHNRAMSRRRARSDPWTIDRDVSPRKAAKHLAAAVAKLTAHAKQQGIDLVDVDAMLLECNYEGERNWSRDRKCRDGRPLGGS